MIAMNSPLATLRHALVAASLALASLLPAAAQAQATERPDVRMWDYWTYTKTDNWIGKKVETWTQTVGRLTSDLIIAYLYRVEDKYDGGLAIFDRDWNTIEIDRYSFKPKAEDLRFPLVPGKTWKSSFTFPEPTAAGVLNCDQTSTVGNWERVRTPAGTFDAIKVSVTGIWRYPMYNWYSYYTKTIWYAPAVNRWVRMEYNDWNEVSAPASRETWELTAYALNGRPGFTPRGAVVSGTVVGGPAQPPAQPPRAAAVPACEGYGCTRPTGK